MIIRLIIVRGGPAGRNRLPWFYELLRLAALQSRFGKFVLPIGDEATSQCSMLTSRRRDAQVFL